MGDHDKTKEQLVEELACLRETVAWLRREAEASQSECQRLQSALDEGRRGLKALLHNLPEKVFHKNRDSVYVACNRNYAADCGLEPEQMVGKTDYDFFPPDIAAKYRADDRRIMASGGAAEIEESYYGPTGEERVIRTVKAALRDEQGQVTGILGIFSDITDRKRAEQALRQSEARYRALAESTADVIYILDESGKLLYANSTAAAYFGVSPESLIGKSQYDLFPPEQASYHLEHIRRVFETGEMGEAEALYRFGPEEVWLNVRTIPLRNEHGQITSAMGVCHNITAQKRAEEALRRAHGELERGVKERTAELTIFRRFAEASGRGFGMADLDGYITYANPTLCRLFGEEKPEDVVGKHISTYYPPESRQTRDGEIGAATLWAESSNGEQVVVARHGARTPVFQDSFLIRDDFGKPFRLAVALADISELKRAAETIRQSESKYRALVESCPDAVVMVDPQGRIVFASERAAQQHRFLHPDELLGLPAADLVVEGDRARLMANIHSLVEDGIRRDVEYTGLRKDGTTFDAEISSVVLRDAAGNPQALMGVYRDVTERKRAAERLRLKDAELLAAAEIQARLLPQESPRLPGFDIAGRCYPAEAAAGDHFDFLRRPDGSLLVVMGDVSGHGIGPAIVAADFCARLRMLSETPCELPEIASQVNAGLYRETAGESFVSAILGRLDPRSRRLTCLNAGHPPGLVLDAAGNIKARLARGGLPLAILPETPFVSDDSVELADDDLVLLYTDGLVEAHRPGQPLFGLGRAIQTIQENRDRTAAEIVETLYGTACRFAGTQPPHDDITVVVVKVLPCTSELPR